MSFLVGYPNLICPKCLADICLIREADVGVVARHYEGSRCVDSGKRFLVIGEQVEVTELS